MLLLTRYFARSCIHLTLGGAFLGESPVFGLDSQELGFASLAWERAVGTENSVVLQAQVSQRPIEAPFDEGTDGPPRRIGAHPPAAARQPATMRPNSASM